MRDNMLINGKINFLKISALAFLGLNKFDAMEEKLEQGEISDNYINENYCLVDEFGNKITLKEGADVKFKLHEDIKNIPHTLENIMKFQEDEIEKFLVGITIDKESNEQYLAPIVCIENTVAVTDGLKMLFFTIQKGNRKNYTKENTILCELAKKTKEETINNNFILADSEGNEIKKIGEKDYKFKLLTREKYFELNKKLDKDSSLKNSKGKYFFNNNKLPLIFEEVDNEIILYFQQKNSQTLAGVNLNEEAKEKITEESYICVTMKEKGPVKEEPSHESQQSKKKKRKPCDCCCDCNNC